MPEGHTIHRAARDQRAMFEGQRLDVSSPQGRFAQGARLIDGATCTGTEAVGKHMLYHFDNGRTLHIHLGLAGTFRPQVQPADPPRDVVRVRLSGPSHVIDIVGPNTCELLEAAELDGFRARYGPDLLADAPEPERAIARIRKSRAAIARLLMDQKVIAGIGNIYRAEILWLRGIHPLTRGADLSEEELQGLWDEMRALLQIGVERNSIITNRAYLKAGRGVGERTNIFGKVTCPKCKGPVEKSKLAARTLYHCPNCQAPRPS
ncbi:MAG: DNA-formamidopyrimidine glycosylase family protein [Pseudomonadota bacterium]